MRFLVLDTKNVLNTALCLEIVSPLRKIRTYTYIYVPIVLPDMCYPNQQQVSPQITRHPLFCYRDETKWRDWKRNPFSGCFYFKKELNGVILCDQSIRYTCNGRPSVFDFLCVYTFGGRMHNSRYPCNITFIVCLFVYLVFFLIFTPFIVFLVKYILFWWWFNT